MRMVVGLRSALMAAGVLGLGCAQDTGREWTSLGAAETALVFTAPGLEPTTKRFMRSDALDYSHSLEIGTWSSPSTLFPKAQLMLQKLSPHYAYTSGIDIEVYIKKLPFLETKNVSISERRSTSTSIGEIIHRAFSFDDFECVAFGQNFGATVFSDLQRELDGADLFMGYYCGDSGDELSPDAIGRVVKSIGVRGVRTPSG